GRRSYALVRGRPIEQADMWGEDENRTASFGLRSEAYCSVLNSLCTRLRMLMERLEWRDTNMCIMRPITACAVAAVATLVTGTVAAQAMTVTCESINYREQQCSVPGGPVALVRQLSTPP